MNSAQATHAQQAPALAPANFTVVNGMNPGEAFLAWTPVSGADQHLVGWLAVEDYEANPNTWREKFAYSDVVSSSTWTVTRLTPGIEYYFIVGRKHAGGISPSPWKRLRLIEGCPTAPTDEPVPPLSARGAFSVSAVNGANPGEVTVSWPAVSGATSYRVGWLALDEFRDYPNTWQQKFAYSNVTASSRYTVSRLTPGAVYVLTVGRKHSGGITWSSWTALKLNPDPAACSAGAAAGVSVPQLYWIDEEARRIQRTREGDHEIVDDLVTRGLQMPGSIALDLSGGKMYWTDDGAHKIQRANLDGSRVEDVVVVPAGLGGTAFGDSLLSTLGIMDPVGIALHPAAERIYWIDRGQGKIFRAYMDGRGIGPGGADTDELVSGLQGAYQIALDISGGKMYWTERNAHRIGRADLDGSGREYLRVSSISDPMGIALDVAGGKMYWTERHTPMDQIRRADLNGRNVEDLVESAPHSLSGLALDLIAGKIYWTDEVADSIRRANLDGTDAEDVITSGLRAPEGIAIGESVEVAPPENPDRAALEALYHATRGRNWTDNTDWLSQKPIGDWSGVDTNGDGRVVKLDLGSNNLFGIIPRELGSLSELEELYLQSNRLRGAIPEELEQLNNLTRLVLFDNRLGSTAGIGHPSGVTISSEIPPELGNLTHLEELDLSYNQLTGQIPSTLGELTRLTTLDLSQNQLSGAIPPALGSLTRLTTLDLSHNGLTGGIPTSLGNIANLNRLVLAGNQLGYPTGAQFSSRFILEEIPADLGRLRQLRTLDLSDNGFGGEIPAGMGAGLRQLEVLNLSGNNLTGPIPDQLGYLGYLGGLVELRLNDNLLSGALPPGLGELDNLTLLDLSDNRLQSSIPTGLGGLRNLEILDLSSNRLDGSIPPALGGSFTARSSLATMNLSDNDLTGAIPVQLGRLRSLTNLDLSHNALNGRIPYLLANLSDLETLDLSGNQLSSTIPETFGQLHRLQTLDLQGNGLLDGEIPPTLANLDDLRALYLGNNNFSMCMPRWLQIELLRIEQNDLDELGLTECTTPGPPEPTRSDQDRYVLTTLYYATDGINWTNTDANENVWRHGDPNSSIEDWYGITTNDQGRVTKIELMGNNLVGIMPKSLASLDQLETLNLLGNDLSGCIPVGLDHALRGPYSEAQNGTMLRRAVNTVEDTSAKGAAISFAVLSFLAHEFEAINQDWGGWRQFSDQTFGIGLPPCPDLPNRPAGWTHHQTSKTDAQALLAIRTYYLSGNRNRPNDVNKFDAGGGWTQDFANYANSASSEDCPDDNPFKTINRRFLPDQTIKGVETEIIGGCHRVIALHLDQRGLRGDIPPAVSRLGQLRDLNMSRNGVGEEHGGLSGSIPSELGNLNGLVKLSLNDNQLSGPIPGELGHLKQLKFLALNANDFSGVMPLELGNLSSIEHLKLVGSGLDGCIPPPIRQNVAPSLLSFANLVTLPAKALEAIGKRTGLPAVKFLGRQADNWGSWWKSEATGNTIKARAESAALRIVPDGSGQSAGLARKAVARVIVWTVESAGDGAAGWAIGVLLDGFGHIPAIFNFISAVLGPVDFAVKPGSTAGWTSLGGVSLNCASLKPLG